MYESFSKLLVDIDQVDPLAFSVQCSSILAKMILREFLHDPADTANPEVAQSQENLKLRGLLANKNIFAFETKSPQAVASIVCYMSDLEYRDKKGLYQNANRFLDPELLIDADNASDIISELNDFFSAMTLIERKVDILSKAYHPGSESVSTGITH